MSGQSAVRGFTYQTIISVIRTLVSDNWAFVKIEPQTELDKVDIIWEDKNGIITCEQIKSSTNNFSVANIVTWLEQMTSDVANAGKYQLTLIGTISENTNASIRTINRGSTDSKIIPENLKNRLKVEAVTFNIEFLESRVRDEVHKFLSNAGYNVSYSSIELIGKGLIYQFLEFSVLSKRVSRQEFADYLLSWATSNYSKTLDLTNQQSTFEVFFYDKHYHQLVSEWEMQSLPRYENIDVNLSIADIRIKYIEGARIILPSRKTEIPEPNEILKQFQTITSLSLSDPTPTRVSEHMRRAVVKGIKEHLNLEVSDSFFDLGQLQTFTNLSGVIPEFVQSYKGSEAEQRKWEIIRSIYWKLVSIEEDRAFSSSLENFCPLKLCIENSGSRFDEEILVKITLPNSVEMFNPEKLKLPNDLETIIALIDSNLASNLLEIPTDSHITGFPHVNYTNLEWQQNHDLLFKISNTGRKKDIKTEELLDNFHDFMTFQTYTDLPGKVVLHFKFEQINPGVRMAFPCVLLVRAQEDFSMQYEVSSKHTGKKYTGNLLCRYPKNHQSVD